MNIEEELARRSRRGKPRGADAVFDGAVSDQTQPNQSTSIDVSSHRSFPGGRVFSVAASIVAVVGMSVLFFVSQRSSPQDISTAASESSVTEPSTGSTTSIREDVVEVEPPVDEPETTPDTATDGVDGSAPVVFNPSSYDPGDYNTVDRGFDDLTVVSEGADRWSVNVTQNGHGNVLVRPKQPFTAADGMIVVEADVAAGREEYGQQTWVELIVSTDSSPDDTSGIFGFDYFESEISIGCRIEANHNVVCDQRVGANPSTNWTASWFEPAGQTSFGGNDSVDNRQFFRHCATGADPRDCLDRFRLELTVDRLTLFVNGVKYFEQSDFDTSKQISSELFSQQFFVYAVSSVTPRSDNDVSFNWGRLAVNPPGEPTASPYYP